MPRRPSKAPATPAKAPATPLPPPARGALLAGAVLVGMAAYTAEALPAVLATVAVNGGMTLLMLLSAIGWGRRVLRLVVGREAWSCLHAASAAGLGLGVHGLLSLGLGLVGILTAGSAWGIMLVGLLWLALELVGSRRAPGNAALPKAPRPTAPQPWPWLVWMPAAFVLGVGLAFSSMLPGVLWTPDDPHPYDAMSYHLQVPREWFAGGAIVPLAHNVFSYFPFGVEVQYLLAMNLHGDAFAAGPTCQYLMLAYAVLTVLAAYGAAVELGCPAQVSAAAAVVTGLVPWTLLLGTVAYVETALMLYTLLAVAWALRGLRVTADAPGAWMTAGPWAIAGAMAGLACGVKYPAVPMVLLGVPAAVVAATLLRRAVPWRGLAIMVLAGVVVFSPWLIRNAVWSGGNPVFPLAMHSLGSGAFSPEQVDRWNTAHSPPESAQGLTGRLSRLWGELLAQGKLGYLLIPLGIAGLLLGRGRERWVIALLCVVQVVVWLGFTHLIARFTVTLIPLLGVLAALAGARLPARWQAWTTAVVVLQLALAVAVMQPALERFGEMGRLGLFGLTDRRPLRPELAPIWDSTSRVVLIGDASAYGHPASMDRLIYRSVFDLRPAGRVLEAWLTPEQMQAMRDDDVLIVSVDEIARLSTTYRHVPGLPDSFPRPEMGNLLIRWKDRAALGW